MTKTPLDFEKVELIRERMMLSIADMAQLLGTTRATYYAWIRGGPIRARNEERVKDVLRQLLPLLKENKWPTPEAKRMVSKERLQALLELLEASE